MVLQTIALSIPLLAFVFFNPWLPSWGSRKVLHMGTGTLLILADATDPLLAYGIYAVTLGFVAIVSVRKLHFADVGDVGIINYLIFCSICVSTGVPFSKVAPLFYADPMGAIVGRNLRTVELWGTGKSLGGTLAVFGTALLTFTDGTWASRAFAAGMIAAIELFSGKWDNPAIGAWLLTRHRLL